MQRPNLAFLEQEWSYVKNTLDPLFLTTPATVNFLKISQRFLKTANDAISSVADKQREENSKPSNKNIFRDFEQLSTQAFFSVKSIFNDVATCSSEVLPLGGLGQAGGGSPTGRLCGTGPRGGGRS